MQRTQAKVMQSSLPATEKETAHCTMNDNGINVDDEMKIRDSTFSYNYKHDVDVDDKK